MKSLLTSALLYGGALSTSRTTAPAGCLPVAKTGGQYSTIQGAVNALSTTSTAPQCIFISPGTYAEQVLVSNRSAQLSIYGYTTDTSTYASNAVTITSNKSQADGLTNDLTGTLRVKANNFKLYNVNVANTYGKGSQAVALSAYADSGYYGCRFTGYQDTLLAQQGHQLYSGCLMQGVTDFVFGQRAPAWFEKCDVRVLAATLGYVTASGRQASTDLNFYVFNSCTIAAASGNTVPAGAFYLGRPWGPYARVVFQRTNMSDVINAAGWHEWNTGDSRTATVTLGEWGNTGVGAEGTRANFSSKLAAPVEIQMVLGSNYLYAGYYDGSYMY